MTPWSSCPTDTWRNNNIVITPKRLCDVIMTLFLRHVSAGMGSICRLTKRVSKSDLIHCYELLLETRWIFIRLSESWVTRQLCIYNDVITSAMGSQITSLTIVYWTVYSDADQRKHQSAASLAFVRGIHRWPMNSPHKWPVTWKMFPFDDVIM